MALDIVPYATLKGTPPFDDDRIIMEEKLLTGMYEDPPPVRHNRCLRLLSALAYLQRCAA